MATAEVTIQRVTQNFDTGWYTVETDQGKYATKIAELASEAKSLEGKHVLLDYDEQVVNKPAPDGSGMRTYRNRYYNRASEAPATNGPAVIEQVSSRRTPREDAWRMCLGVGAKCAVDTLALMPNEQRTFDIQKTIALAWAKFLFFTPMPDAMGASAPPTPEEAYRPFAGVGAEHPGAYDEPGGGYERPPAPGDQDIPF
jgi:hypothetical protein